jgi:hypothetical protein
MRVSIVDLPLLVLPELQGIICSEEGDPSLPVTVLKDVDHAPKLSPFLNAFSLLMNLE